MLVWQTEFFLARRRVHRRLGLDTLDGRYSRMSGKGTPFGAFLDSTLDRIEEGIVLTAVAAYVRRPRQNELAVAAVVVAVLASLMVSYTRARAEALGVECKVGIATPRGPRRDPVRGPRAGATLATLLEPAVYVLAGLRADHRPAAHLPRPPRAHRGPAAV